MKNFLGLFLLLSLAGQPHAQASEATDNSIPSAVTHQSGNISDTSIEDLLKLRKKYPLKPAKATKAEVQRAIDFIKTFDTAKMETVKIEDTRKLAAAIRALAYAAQENLPEGSEFSPYLDKVLNDGVIERIPAFPYNSYTDVRVVPVDFLSALPVCTPEQQGRLIESVKGLMEFYKLNQKDAILKRTVNSDYLYNVLPHLFVCALHNPDNAQAAEDLRSFSRYLSACTQYVPGEKDILKPDGTGFHHKTHYNGYMYSYRTWVEYMGRLKGTAFRITRDAYQRMSKAIVSVYLMATSSASDTEHFYANSLAGTSPALRAGRELFQSSFPRTGRDWRRYGRQRIRPGTCRLLQRLLQNRPLQRRHSPKTGRLLSIQLQSGRHLSSGELGSHHALPHHPFLGWRNL